MARMLSIRFYKFDDGYSTQLELQGCTGEPATPQSSVLVLSRKPIDNLDQDLATTRLVSVAVVMCHFSY
jgi:hypothetical protein